MIGRTFPLRDKSESAVNVCRMPQRAAYSPREVHGKEPTFNMFSSTHRTNAAPTPSLGVRSNDAMTSMLGIDETQTRNNTPFLQTVLNRIELLGDVLVESKHHDPLTPPLPSPHPVPPWPSQQSSPAIATEQCRSDAFPC